MEMNKAIRLVRSSILVIIVVVIIWKGFEFFVERQPNPIEISAADKRSYRALTLPNQMRVILISDETTDKAAASLDVYVGSNQDFDNREGLAHFLEHMLFLGTEKYPEPGEYQAFISAHGGGHNAYTSDEHTNYFFDIDPNYFEPALDRFAQFFHAPLFNSEYVEKEKNAVHSEYQARKKSESRREMDVIKQVLNRDHPFSRFSIGSLETLADRPSSSVTDDLKKFYEQYYSSNLMTLVVLSNQDLSTLETWVRQYFGDVKDKNTRIVGPDAPLLFLDQLPKLVSVKPDKETRSLSFMFPLPNLQSYYPYKPLSYIGHLLGHEGEGSLYQVLKKKGWIQSLGSGIALQQRGVSVFQVQVGLTPNGVNHVNDIGRLLFETIHLVQNSGVNEDFYDEIKQISDVEFRFQQKQEPIYYVRRLSSLMHDYPTHHVLTGPSLYQGFKPELISELLNYLTPQRVLVSLMAPEIEHTPKFSPWFDVAYDAGAIDELALASWNAARKGQSEEPAVTLPKTNDYIPEQFELVEDETEKKTVPELLVEESGFQVWYEQDGQFSVPKSDFFLSVRSPIAVSSARNAMLTKLFLMHVEDQLKAELYSARLAGLSYNLYDHLRGFSLSITGFYDKQAVLLERVLEELVNTQFDETLFMLHKEDLMRQLRNADRKVPYIRVLDTLNQQIVKPSWSELEKLAVLENISFADLTGFAPLLIQKLSLVALSHGNVDEKQTLALVDVVRESLLTKATISDVDYMPVERIGDLARFTLTTDVKHSDTATLLYIQGRDDSLLTRAKFLLLEHVISSPFYQKLRTEQQLGYVVFSSPRTIREWPGMVFAIQSPVSDAVSLTHHMDLFFKHFEGELKLMSKDAFEEHRAGLISTINSTDKTMYQKAQRLWREIDRENMHFDTRERITKSVKALSQRALLEFFQEYILSQKSQMLIYGLPSLDNKQKATLENSN